MRGLVKEMRALVEESGGLVKEMGELVDEWESGRWGGIFLGDACAENHIKEPPEPPPP